MGRNIEFAPRPGIVKDTTANASTGYWTDCDKVRFRKGFPEKIGGWVRYSTNQFLGVCRALYTWVTLDDSLLTAVGTNKKYYVEESGTLNDVTPIVSTATLGTDPLESDAIGSGVIIVNDAAHGQIVGNFVIISGATTFDGLTTGQLNQELEIIEIIDADHYTVDTGGVATAGGVSGGGAAVEVDYLLGSGSASAVYGNGWGAGAWSRGAWSSAAESTTLTSAIRLWSQDNYGEDLLFAPRYGVIYRYDGSSGGRAVAISTEGGANEVPTTVTEVLVSPDERIVFALGCNEIGSADHDELLVRWSDYENYLEWEPSSTTGAGGFRLTSGSRIITGLRAAGEILVWTDTSLFAITFSGSEDVYQNRLVDPNSNIIGPMAKISIGGTTYWMGDRGFYMYDGRVIPLQCSMEDYIFGDLSEDGRSKIVAGSNARFNEVWWFYPSNGSDEPDRYVVYNTIEQIWYHGTLDRTFWIDRGLYNYPRAASTDGYLYTHEFGLDDGSTTPVSAITSYVTSAPVELGGNEDMGRGDRVVFVNKMIPDVTFRQSTGAMPTLTYTFNQRNYPGNAYFSEGTSVAKGATVDQYTDKKSIRLRARALSLTVSNSEVGTDWRLGVQRFETRTDGRKR